MEPNSKDMTLLLQRMKGGDNDAANQLVALLYQELRRMAGAGSTIISILIRIWELSKCDGSGFLGKD
jgi:hypothetical protein